MKRSEIAIALLIVLLILTLVTVWAQQHSDNRRGACEQECHDQGLDRWFYDANTEECTCSSTDPV